MSDLIVYLISGIVAGAIYSVYASGLTLVRATTGVYNLAFGSLAFVADLFFYEVTTESMPRWLAFIVTVFLFGPALGLLLEWAVFRRLARVPEHARLIATVGLLLGLPALGTELVKLLTEKFHMTLAPLDAAYSVPGVGPEPPHVYKILGRGALTSDQLILVVISGAAVLAIWLLLTRTRLGLMTRAVVDQPVLAAARGIDPALTSRTAWVLGSILAAIAGVLAGPIFGLSVDAVLELVIAASAVVVIAQFRSLPVAMLGGLALGALSSLFSGFGGDVPGLKSVLNTVPGTRSSIIYLVLLVALLVRGRERGRVAGITSAAEPVPIDHAAGLPPWRRAWPWALLIGAVLLWGCDIVPWGHIEAGGLEQSLLVQGLGLALVFLSFNVVVGQLGVASLAQAAMVTTGALMAGFVVHHHWLGGSFAIAVLMGALAAAVLGVLVALPALRLGGLALALATLAIGYVCDHIVFQLNQFNNFNTGWTLHRPKLGPLDFGKDKTFIVFLALVLLLAMWLVTNIRRSAIGRAIAAVRFAPAAAVASGVSIRRVILIAFGVSGFLAGLGGALLAYGSGTVAPNSWPTETGLLWLMIAVLQGVRRPAAAIVGGLVTAFFSRVLETGFWGVIPDVKDPAIATILFGIGCVALANEPDGVLQQIGATAAAVRGRLGRRATGEARTEPPARTERRTTVLDNGVRPAPRERAAAPSDRSPNPAATDAALSIRGLEAGYGDARVLHGVDLDVPRGAMVALLGPNGAGKSTLCAAIAGTLTATAGSIVLDGTDITRLPAHRRVRAGVLLAPESRGIFPRLSVEDNLAILLRSKAERERALERFPQLARRRALPAASLSGGEQQMLCLASVLLDPPPLLVADEASLGLARTVVAEVMAVLTELRDSGVSILVVEEKAANVLVHADHVAFLSGGVVSRSGPIGDFTDEVAREAYLGSAAVT